jgi:Predicted ATPase
MNLDEIETSVSQIYAERLDRARKNGDWTEYTQLYFMQHAEYNKRRQEQKIKQADTDAERKALRKVSDFKIVNEFQQVSPVDSDEWLSFYAKHRLDDEITGSRLSSIKSVAHADGDVREDNIPTYAIRTWDGIVNATTKQLEGSVDGVTQLFSKHFIPHYDPKAQAPNFKRVLDDLNTDENPTLGQDLLKMYAYATFGGNKLKAMFILYGDGNDGKSLIQDAVENALGDYVSTIKADSVQFRPRVANEDKFMTWLLGGVGGKFFKVSEFPEHGMLNNSVIKLLHAGGGGNIKLETKFSNTPTKVKLNMPIIMDTNFLPDVTHVEPALLRRLVVLKFHKQYLGDDIDYTLPDKLRREKAGILNMLIDAYDPDWQIPDKYKNLIDDERESQLQDHVDTIESIVENVLGLKIDMDNTDRYLVKNVHNASGLSLALKNNGLKKKDLKSYLLENGVREIVGQEGRVYVGLRKMTINEQVQHNDVRVLSSIELDTEVQRRKELPF